jgi:hypothetical protein
MMPRMVRHIQGPVEFDCEPDELIVLCVVRNGEYYVRSYIDHYSKLGAKHIVFLLNDSTDGTLDLLRRHDVTILSTDAPYARYEVVMNHYLMNRFARDRWSLLADIDELFDFPCSHVLSLRDFLRYLNHHRFTAVLTQVLDMFAPGPLGRERVAIGDDITQLFTHYDLSGITKQQYTWPGLTNSQIQWHFGGVRASIFGTNSSLTKPALLFFERKLRIFFEVHHVMGARIADVSCLLRHYPFVGRFREKVAEAIATRRYSNAKWDYDGYWRILEHDPHPVIGSAAARNFDGTQSLIEEGFLIVSDEYRRWVEAHAAHE